MRAIFRRAAALVAAISLSWASPGPARADAPAGLSAAERSKNVESFEVVWRTIRDTHFDPKLGGLDWQAVHDELKPRVEKAVTMAEARAAIGEALERLHQTHFGILPAEGVRALDDGPKAAGGPGETGIEVREVEGRAVVTAVAPGSTAEAAGVKPGWVVQAIRGRPIPDVLAAVEKAYAKSGMLQARKSLAVAVRLRGAVGGTVPVEFIDGKDRVVHIDVPLMAPRGVPARFGNLPTFYVRFDSRRVEGTIGYVSLSAFFDAVNVMRQFAEAMKAHGDAEGLVLDLRGNPGGIGAMSMGLGGWFVTEPNRKLGTMITRDSSLNFTLNPRPVPFVGPVAILVDEMSMSTSEILAGGLKDLGRAEVFGTRTPGAALPSRVDLLPNGDGFQYAFANYISHGGKPLEGVGVIPDTEVTLTRTALLEGRDPALDAAVRWLRSQPRGAKAPRP